MFVLFKYGIFPKKKETLRQASKYIKPYKNGICPMAGTEGFEPSRTVLERLATLVKIGQNPSKIGLFRNNSGHF